MYSSDEFLNIREKIMSQTLMTLEYNPLKLTFSLNRLSFKLFISVSNYEIGNEDYHKHFEKIYTDEVIRNTELLNRFLKLMRRDKNLTLLVGDK
jgi:hypothetical protein